jgi:membrane-anchored protein YejM (alkaline phosphatase superfamily)
MKILRIVVMVLFAAVLARESRLSGSHAPEAPGLKTRNIILVTTDGLRWQEVFGGADPALLNFRSGIKDLARVMESFNRDTPEERRKALMPFLWGTIAEKGQLFGDAGDEVRVANGRNFSYPGYNEILTGSVDPRIDNNNKTCNPNVTVLEWLNRKEEFRHRVAAFCSWDVFPFILNRWRSRVRVQAAWKHPIGKYLSDEERVIAQLMRESPRLWEECCFDTFTFRSAMGYIKRRRPRVLYIALGETDEWGHAGRYDQYLHAAHRVDQYLKTLWEMVQSMPEYRGNTTIIVTTDHGRGNAPVEWKDHGAKTQGSDRIWIAVMGPDTAPRPHEPRGNPTASDRALTQGQVASTLAAFLGLDYCGAAPKAAPPIAGVLPPRVQVR